MDDEPFDIDDCLRYLDNLPERLRLVIARVQDAMFTDGAQHKQFYLIEIAQLLGLDVSDVDAGVEP